jgi:integrase
MKWGLLSRNVTDAVDPPRRQSPEMRVWSVEEAAKVLASAKGADLEALWSLAITTGMRRGEILASGGGMLISKPERSPFAAHSLGGQRAAWKPVSQRPWPAVAAWRSPRPRLSDCGTTRRKQKALWLAVGAGYADREIVFATVNGTPIHPNTLSRAYNKLIECAKVPRIRFHDLRHTSATLLLASGEHPKVVQERLGHASISETLDRYSHVSPDMQSERRSGLTRCGRRQRRSPRAPTNA